MSNSVPFWYLLNSQRALTPGFAFFLGGHTMLASAVLAQLAEERAALTMAF